MSNKRALVVGASGLVGSSLIRHLATDADWHIAGISRGRPPVAAKNYQHLSFDLLDKDACRQALKDTPGVTHVFLAARVKDATFEELETKNVEILSNLMESLEAHAPDLNHIQMVHGTKWYGSHLGPTNVPAREDDPRQMPPNPYYAQQDYVADCQRGKNWTWSSVRPGLIMGAAIGYPHNIVALVAGYAAICRELGVPLRFPGSQQCYNLVQTCIDVRILCKACTWVSQRPECANQPFNVSNGDLFSWSNLWPRIADFYGMQCGHVQPLPFSEYMSDKEKVWQRIVKKEGLREIPLSSLIAWSYGDYHFNKVRSDIVSNIKLWKTGFHEFIDSEELFLELLRTYRKEQVFP